MPGLKILTVKSKNGDSSHAGEYLFNGRGVHGIFGSDGDVHLLFSANKVEGGIVYDDYLVDESVSDVTGVLGSYGINGATDTYYIEVFDVGAGTVIKGFSAKDIMMGVDDRNGNALLYIDTGIGVRKYLSDGSISEIETLYAGGGGGGSDTQSYMTDKDGDPVPDKQDNNIEIK